MNISFIQRAMPDADIAHVRDRIQLTAQQNPDAGEINPFMAILIDLGIKRVARAITERVKHEHRQKKMARLGKIATCGATTISARASFIAPPLRCGRLRAKTEEGQAGGGDDGRADTRMEKYTTMDEIVPGKTRCSIIVIGPAPRLRAASTNVWRLSDSVLPRTKRANAGMLKIATARMTFAIPLPRTATTLMARRMPGRRNSTSQTRMTTRSPPAFKIPEVRPRSVPTTAPNQHGGKPAASEMRARSDAAEDVPPEGIHAEPMLERGPAFNIS